jgi:predicted RNase H-like nuclease
VRRARAPRHRAARIERLSGADSRRDVGGNLRRCKPRLARTSGPWNVQTGFRDLPKIREVDEALRANPQLRERVYEVHPEVTFRVWRGAAMNHSKKTQAGHADRIRLISAHFGEDAFETVRAKHRPRDVADDDILDAFAALRTAERIANGVSRSLPEVPPFDAAGLPMRIVY